MLLGYFCIVVKQWVPTGKLHAITIRNFLHVNVSMWILSCDYFLKVLSVQYLCIRETPLDAGSWMSWCTAAHVNGLFGIQRNHSHLLCDHRLHYREVRCVLFSSLRHRTCKESSLMFSFLFHLRFTLTSTVLCLFNSGSSRATTLQTYVPAVAKDALDSLSELPLCSSTLSCMKVNDYCSLTHLWRNISSSTWGAVLEDSTLLTSTSMSALSFNAITVMLPTAPLCTHSL